MTTETFFEKFELFADTPNAVAKMRELVLSLAVQGKLVAQDPEDEPAAELLKRIEEAKTQLIKHRTIKRLAVGTNPTDDLCAQLPTGWVWTRLGNAFDVRDGTHDTPKYVNEGFPLITSKNIYSGRLSFDGANLISEKDHRQICERSRVERGDILFAMIGSIGNPVIVDTDREFSIKNVALFKYYAKADAESRFLLLYLKLVAEEMKANAAGAVQSFVSLGFLRNYMIPLPPLAEQRRIVARVDELMGLCNRLEEQQKERETRQGKLVRAAIGRFGEAPTPANLEVLFHPAVGINPSELRKTILTLAVQGKLVAQDPEDEPAGELLKRIEELRRTRKAKQYLPVEADDMSFEIPYSWTWSRLGNISLSSDSGWSPQCLPEARSGMQWGVLKVSAVSWGIFKPEENKALPPGVAFRPDCEVQAGDFLLSRANTEELVARSVIVHETPSHLMMSDKVVRFTFPDEIEKRFINLANLSDPARSYYARNASGTSSSMKNVGREVMCNLPIPLPPLAEQRRIVARVEELMGLVDELEGQLVESRERGGKLMAALVGELVGELTAR